MEDTWIEIKLFFMKNIAIIAMVFSSAILKAKIDLKNKLLTMRERIISFICAVALGGAAGIAVNNSILHETTYGLFVVPTVTLFGEVIATWVYGHIDPIMTAALEKWKNK